MQRGREEKLLYLLKQTGEEYLAAKEEYERQLRLYNSESLSSTRQKLNAAQAKNEELERQVAALELQIEELKNRTYEEDETAYRDDYANSYADASSSEKDVPSPVPYDENKTRVRLLKQKALEAQKMLDERTNGNGGAE